jgi:hypothetical protein
MSGAVGKVYLIIWKGDYMRRLFLALAAVLMLSVSGPGKEPLVIAHICANHVGKLPADIQAKLDELPEADLASDTFDVQIDSTVYVVITLRHKTVPKLVVGRDYLVLRRTDDGLILYVPNRGPRDPDRQACFIVSRLEKPTK